MSDFGTMVIVQRSDGQEFSEVDRTRVEAVAHQVKHHNLPTCAIAQTVDFQIAEYRSAVGVEGVTIDLTQHWLEDAEKEGIEPETLMEQERPCVEQIGNTLQKLLGDEYSLELVCDRW